MRENLFKAKKWDNGEWIEGYFVKIKDVTEHNLILTGELSKGAYTDFIGYEVDPETLCQFTGLCDKNGKRIWENDILMAHSDESYPENVTYETIEWGVAGWVTHEANSVGRQYLDEFDLEHFEVVGNIFDNKELLQEVPE